MLFVTLKKKQEKGLSLLFITHRMHVLKHYADGIYILEAQKIRNSGSHEALLETKNPYSEFWEVIMR